MTASSLPIIAGLAACLCATAAHAADKILVLTDLLPTYSLASALTDGTSIEVANIPEAAESMTGLTRTFARPTPRTRQLLHDADAVITIGGAWPEDPLFSEAREANLAVIEIDAATSLGKSHASVSRIRQPVNDAPWHEPTTGDALSPYVWLSPSNGIRMAEIIATDLVRLSPDDADTVRANLKAFSDELLALKAEYEARFLSLDNASVFALTDRFVYLTNEFGIYVEGYFLEQDVRWTPADLDGLSQTLASRDIPVVLHQWQPAAPIAAAITAGSADLLVLGDGETHGADPKAAADPRGYQAMLRADLEALYQALRK